MMFKGLSATYIIASFDSSFNCPRRICTQRKKRIWMEQPPHRRIEKISKGEVLIYGRIEGIYDAQRRGPLWHRKA